MMEAEHAHLLLSGVGTTFRGRRWRRWRRLRRSLLVILEHSEQHLRLRVALAHGP